MTNDQNYATIMTQGENMDLKHFVTYYSLGDIQNNEQTLEVKSNDLVSLNIPNGTFGFKTFDRATDDIYKDGDKIVEKNEVLNEKTFYIGKVTSLDEIKEEFGENSTAYKNLIKGGYYGAVRTADNFLIPLALNEKINILAPEEIGIVCYYSENEPALENE